MYKVVVNNMVDHYNGDNYMAALAVYNRHVLMSKTNDSITRVQLLVSGHPNSYSCKTNTKELNTMEEQGNLSTSQTVVKVIFIFAIPVFIYLLINKLSNG